MGWLSRAFGGDARAPRDVDGAMRSALLAVLDRDWDAAERLLVDAARRDSEDVEPYLALARLLRSRGEIGRAIRIHQNLLLRLEAGSPQARVALADLAADFRQGGFLRRAIASYEELLAHDPRHTGALRALVKLRAEVRDFEPAIEAARRLARLEGTDAAPVEAGLRVQLAEMLREEGRNQEARRAVKRALRRDRRCIPAWRLLGELEAERERPKAALSAWSRIPDLDRREGARIHPQLEATYAALDRPREFEAFLRSLLEKEEDPASRIALARHLAARGETDAALEELRKVIAAAPEELDARITLGRLLLSEHRDAAAVEAYRELLDALERRRSGRAGEGLE